MNKQETQQFKETGWSPTTIIIETSAQYAKVSKEFEDLYEGQPLDERGYIIHNEETNKKIINLINAMSNYSYKFATTNDAGKNHDLKVFGHCQHGCGCKNIFKSDEILKFHQAKKCVEKRKK